MPVTKAQMRAQEKYDRNNTVQIHLKFNKNTDADILARLEQVSIEPGGKQGYIKALIREDIRK